MRNQTKNIEKNSQKEAEKTYRNSEPLFNFQRVGKRVLNSRTLAGSTEHAMGGTRLSRNGLVLLQMRKEKPKSVIMHRNHAPRNHHESAPSLL